MDGGINEKTFFNYLFTELRGSLGVASIAIPFKAKLSMMPIQVKGYMELQYNGPASTHFRNGVYTVYHKIDESRVYFPCKRWFQKLFDVEIPPEKLWVNLTITKV